MSPPRVILITGASGGIGRSCAVYLSNTFPGQGDDRQLVLVLSGRRQGELETTASECKEGTTTEIVVGDVSKDDDVASMFKTVKEKYGRLDVLFNVSVCPGQRGCVDRFDGTEVEQEKGKNGQKCGPGMEIAGRDRSKRRLPTPRDHANARTPGSTCSRALQSRMPI